MRYLRRLLAVGRFIEGCIASERCISSRMLYDSGVKLVSTRRFMSGLRERRRFYASAGLEEVQGGYQITVDGRKVKTPGRKPLVVPSKQLAVAMATEWNMQRDTIKPDSMHLTSLSNTVIDQPNVQTQEQRIEHVFEFLYTDTVCFPASEPDDLVNLQRQEWNPLINWFCERFNVSISTNKSLLGPTISSDDTNKLRNHLASVNSWSMTGLEYAVATSKSFITTMGLLENHLSVERAAYLARLELEFQIGRWGSVEWAHDVDLMELRCRLAAAALFYHLTTQARS